MAISDSDRESSKDYSEGSEEEECSSNYGSDAGYDSATDPSYSMEEDTRSKFQNLSVKKKSRSGAAKKSDISIEKDQDEMEMDFPEVDDKSYENIQKIIKAGKLEKLKVDECKIYLRKNGLRLSGNKDTLIRRIKEHLEISNGEGEKKYPLSSFVLNCKGDACTGDVVMFEQNVYEMFNLASRSASGPPCGTRIVAGRIVKESYGTAKQQHTFTIEVLWSKGEKPLPPLHPLLIKGRNLYRLKTLRQRWEDEGERQKVLMEKHSRGSLARSDREVRIQEKERRKMLRENRIFKREDRPQQPGSSINSGIVAPQHQQSSSNAVAGNLTSQTCGLGSLFDLEKPSIKPVKPGFLAESQQLAVQPQQQFYQLLPEKKMIQRPEQPGYYPNFRTGSFQPEYRNFHPWNNNQNQIPRKLPETNYYRQPMRSMNHCHPATVPQRQGFLSQQLCRYHAQGQCYYGENCKFLHEAREVHRAEEKRC